jgi:hypothetical protein
LSLRDGCRIFDCTPARAYNCSLRTRITHVAQTEKPKTGGCVCGQLTYEISGGPKVCLSCHCTFSQRLSGSAYSTIAYYYNSQVSLLGEFREYEHRSDETGRTAVLKSCPGCGVTVVYAPAARPGWIAVTLGSMDDNSHLRVERHVWIRSKQARTEIPDDVDQYLMGSADGETPIVSGTASDKN